jgi:hypothetical protein
VFGAGGRAPEIHASPFLAAAEGARWVVLGRVADPREVDVHGFEATLTVERAVVGADPAGAVLRIGWEQLTHARVPQLEAGSRVLVALAPLPTQSLWRKRFPEGDARVLAGRGAGFVAAPDAPSLGALQRFLSLPPELRGAGAGVAALADLAAHASPRLAVAALARLGEVDDLAAQLSPAVAARLSGVAEDPARPVGVRTAVLGLAATRRLVALRPAAVVAAEGGPPLEVAGRETLAALDGGVPAGQVEVLLEHEEPALRALAVRHARGTPVEGRVAEAIRSDPAPEVRVAAVQMWCEWHGVACADAVEPALFDAAPPVRGAAAESLGVLGDPLVSRLVALARAREGGSVAGPLWALRHAGPLGFAELRRLAIDHPDPRARKLAAVIAGRPLPEH